MRTPAHTLWFAFLDESVKIAASRRGRPRKRRRGSSWKRRALVAGLAGAAVGGGAALYRATRGSSPLRKRPWRL